MTLLMASNQVPIKFLVKALSLGRFEMNFIWTVAFHPHTFMRILQEVARRLTHIFVFSQRI